MGSIEADEKVVAPNGDDVATETMRSEKNASVHEGKGDYIPDIAADIVHAAEEEFTEEQFRKVLRKVDWILLPLMWVRVDHQVRCTGR